MRYAQVRYRTCFAQIVTLQMAALDAFVEFFALTFLYRHGSKELQGSFASLIASSHPTPAPTFHDARSAVFAIENSRPDSAELDGLQWVAMQRCEGHPIGRAISPLLAAELGRLLAALHKTPLPLKNSGGGNPRTLEKPRHAADPSVVGESRGSASVDCGTPGGTPDRASGGFATFFKDEHRWREGVEVEGGGVVLCEGCGEWEPFLEFLQRKAGEVHADMFSAAELPLHLLQMLEEYLPQACPQFFSISLLTLHLRSGGHYSKSRVIGGPGK
jgi:hypothetical protein